MKNEFVHNILDVIIDDFLVFMAYPSDLSKEILLALHRLVGSSAVSFPYLTISGSCPVILPEKITWLKDIPSCFISQLYKEDIRPKHSLI